jgi:hypothetical protein
VQGWGTTAAQAFEQAACALTAVITHAEVKSQTLVQVQCEAPDLWQASLLDYYGIMSAMEPCFSMVRHSPCSAALRC